VCVCIYIDSYDIPEIISTIILLLHSAIPLGNQNTADSLLSKILGIVVS